MLEKLLNLLFPPKCELCNTLGKYICETCYEELKKYELKNNGKEEFFLYKYEEQIRKMLIKYKFNGKGYLCNLFSTCILSNKEACKFISSYDIVIPVPLHRKRKNERGYNQSELVAKKVVNKLIKSKSWPYLVKGKQQNNLENIEKITKHKSIELNTTLIKKIKNTKPQSTQKLKERINMVKGIYKVQNIELIRGKRILIFDDIYTTGSTYNECKKVLLEAGAKEVGIFTIARDFMK